MDKRLKFFKIPCSIKIRSQLLPSEDPDKVKQSMETLIPEVNLEIFQDEIVGEVSSFEALSKIIETIHARKSERIYGRILRSNMNGDFTKFFFNKQASFVGVITICEEEEESPLGPIEIEIKSNRIEEIIDLITEKG